MNTPEQPLIPSSSISNPDGDERKITAYRLQPSRMKIVPSPADRDWMDATRDGWANRCLPLRVANQAGWLLLNDCDVEVAWNGKPGLDSLDIRFPEGQKSQHVRSLFGYGILTWTMPYLFRTPPGYNLLVRGPVNTFKPAAHPLEGLVETDWSVASFTMNWKITIPEWTVKFLKDEPIALILPQRRGELEEFHPEVRNIQSEPKLMKAFTDWARSRVEFAQTHGNQPPPKDKPLPWQKHYTLGTAPGGDAAEEHQVKLALRPFVDRDPVAIPGKPAQESPKE